MTKKRFVFLLIHLIVITLCLASTTVAWIALNRRLDSQNQAMTIQAVSDVTTISCYALRYDGTLGAICYKIGEGTDEVLDVEMTEFDRIFRDRSVNTPLIYIVELGNVPDEENFQISVKVPCMEKYIRAGDSTLNSFVYPTDSSVYSIQNFISNVISVKIACSGRITEPTPTTTTRVENNVNLFKTQSLAFRSVTEGSRVGSFSSRTISENTISYTKEDTVIVSLSESEYEEYLYTVQGEEETGNHLVLYIQFDYDQDLMDAYIGLLSDENSEDINFADDLGIIQIIVGTGGSS